MQEYPCRTFLCQNSLCIPLKSHIAKSWETVPAQPVDATPSNRLIRQYFPSRIDLYGSTQSEPKQGSVLFESMLANEISLVDSYKKSSSKCCIDPLRPPDFTGVGKIVESATAPF